jgi:hypothetical protein
MFQSAKRKWINGRLKSVLDNEPRLAAGEQRERFSFKMGRPDHGRPFAFEKWRGPKRNDLVDSVFRFSLLFGHDHSDLASPAEAGHESTSGEHGFAQAGNWCPLFGIMP